MTATTAAGVRLGSVVLGSADPRRLRSWYRTILAIEPDDGGAALELGGGSRLIFDRRSDVATQSAEPGRLLVNLYVDDLEAVTARLAGLDVTWIRPVEPFPPGLIGTIRDPDGNYLQVIQLARRSAP
jgi:hypothetical protein